MSLPDKHDERRFKHYVRIGAGGTVAAVIEVATDRPAPVPSGTDRIIDVTALYPCDLHGMTADAIERALQAIEK